MTGACLRSFLFLPVMLSAILARPVCAAPPTPETLRIAVHTGALHDVGRTDVEVSLKLWAEEMARVLEVPADIRLYPGMAEIRGALESGQANFVIADGIDLLRYFGPEALVDGFGGRGRAEDNLVLIARKAAGIRSFKDLSGKRIVLLADNEISDLWLETACLRTFQRSCQRASVLLGKEKRSSQQVLKVFFDKADAALMRGYSYELALELNPQIGQQVQIVERIPIYPGALGLFSSRLSPGFRDYVIGLMPTLHTYPRGRQLMELLQAERVERFPKAVLDPIRELMREHAALSARHAGRAGNP